MELSPIDRIEAFCRDKGIGSLSELGRLIGASTGTFSIIKKRGRPPGTQVMQMLAEKYPDLNSNWVLYGRGSMYINDQRLTPATPLPTPQVVAEPAAPYGCLAPGLVTTLRLEVTELRTENKTLRDELREARREFRLDFIAQARQYNSVKVSQEELITRLYARVDEYELRLGFRQPTPEERQRMTKSEGDAPIVVKPFGARYREAALEEVEARHLGGKVLALYPAMVSHCEAA